MVFFQIRKFPYLISLLFLLRRSQALFNNLQKYEFVLN